jgi:two-component system, cell cycle response regulator DivK
VRGALILLVEDNADNQDIYRTILEHGGHSVVLADDGEQAARRALADLPSVILMDISIPLVDGYEATRRIKGDHRTKHIPVIALTAHAQLEDRERAAEAGCDVPSEAC